MAQLTPQDRLYVEELVVRSAGGPNDGLARTMAALAPGLSESTVDGQHSRAIAYWQAHQADMLAQAPSYATTAVGDAITHLQQRQLKLRGATANYTGDR